MVKVKAQLTWGLRGSWVKFGQGRSHCHIGIPSIFWADPGAQEGTVTLPVRSFTGQTPVYRDLYGWSQGLSALFDGSGLLKKYLGMQQRLTEGLWDDPLLPWGRGKRLPLIPQWETKRMIKLLGESLRDFNLQEWMVCDWSKISIDEWWGGRRCCRGLDVRAGRARNRHRQRQILKTQGRTTLSAESCL